MTDHLNILDGLGLPELPATSPDAIAALLWARELLQQHATTKYGVNNSKGIDQLLSVKIGGVDQWLHIRGRNKRNPILLYLHGGPGGCAIGGGGDAYTRHWEDYFTVVLWDQRQTGKSYYPACDEDEPLTVERFIQDTIEVVDYLRGSLNKQKVVLMGASWGTTLGMHVAKRHPDWVHAYIGVGQVVNSVDNEKVLYQRLLGHAKAQHRQDIVDRVERALPLLDADFPDREKSMVENVLYVRRELSRLAGETLMHDIFWDDALKMLSLERLTSPQLTLTDISNNLLGDKMAVYRPPYTFTEDFLNVDLPADLGSCFDVPIFFFTGVHDWNTPVSLSDQWFSQIEAPHKELIHFEESCHSVVNEEPGKFLMSLVNRVLPLVQDEPQGGE